MPQSKYPETKVRFRDRVTQDIVVEINQSESTLRWLYDYPLGRLILRLCLNNSLFCWLYGVYQALPHTRRNIAGFVASHHIKVAEIERPLDSYRSFNSFFSRRLKPDARPFAAEQAVLCSPADGKALVLPILTTTSSIPVKGARLNPASLLNGSPLAQRFVGGSAIVIRLAPYDYHRFHFFDDGDADSAQLICGRYHSVHPFALAQVPEIFHLNRRAFTCVRTQNFGTVVQIEIGAIAVASIQQTYEPGEVLRGQEKGFFQYGGSTVAILFEPGRVTFDADLVRDSHQGLEVSVVAGERMGCAGSMS